MNKNNKVTIHGTSKGLVVSGCFMLFIIIAFSVYAFCLSIAPDESEEIPLGFHIVWGGMAFFIFSFSVLCLVYLICMYEKKICIYDDHISFTYPFREKKVISKDDLQFWGHVAYFGRDETIFFCFADKNTLVDYLNSNWDACYKIFGKEKADSLKCDEEGIINLALSTYMKRSMFCRQKDVIAFDLITSHRLEMLVNALERDALLIGPGQWDKSSFEYREFLKYAKYTPKK